MKGPTTCFAEAETYIGASHTPTDSGVLQRQFRIRSRSRVDSKPHESETHNPLHLLPTTQPSNRSTTSPDSAGTSSVPHLQLTLHATEEFESGVIPPSVRPPGPARMQMGLREGIMKGKGDEQKVSGGLYWFNPRARTRELPSPPTHSTPSLEAAPTSNPTLPE